MTSERPTCAVLNGDAINNGTYTLECENITSWFSSEDVVVVRLKMLRLSKKIIGTFQLPDFLQKQDYPLFNADKRFLLILNASWSVFYNPHPTSYEWNLFDLTQQKTIKTFPWQSYPIFMKDKKHILLKSGTEISLTEEEIPEPPLTPWE